MAEIRLLNNVVSLEALTKLTKDQLAPDFSPFEFMHADEMLLSKVLSWMLDPSGSHGQGSRFLKLFVAKISKCWPDEVCSNACVMTEICVEDGRTDIYVSHREWVFIVENKPWAADQQNQLDKYFRHLQQVGRIASEHTDCSLDNNKRFVVYLTQNGSEPSDYSIDRKEIKESIRNGKLLCISYRTHLLEWISECHSVCRAERVATFLNEFYIYLQKLLRDTPI